MSLDTFGISALVDEFTQQLVGGRVQDSVELDRETFGFEIYANRQRHYLLVSANKQEPRALIAPDKLRRGVQTPSTLGLLLRTRIEGTRLNAVRQPPWERIIIFEFSDADSELELVVEVIPRRANIILVEGSTILDCARRIGPKDNRYRIILPKHEYVAPPPIEGKTEPAEVTPETIDRFLRQKPKDKAWSALVGGILGFSPLIAREVVHRAYQDLSVKAQDANPYNLHAAFESFVPRLLRHNWQPGVILDELQLPKDAVAFEVTHLAYERTDSLSAALNRVHGEMEGEAAYNAAREPIRKQIHNARDRVQRKLSSLERELADESEIEKLRMSGELLLAYQYTIEPEQETLEAQYDPEGDPLQIKLNTELTPLENAQRYFERYDKKKRALEQIPKRITLTRNELAYIDQLESDLDMSGNWNDIGEVQDALQRNGYWQGKRYSTPKGGKSAPYKVTTNAGFVIFVGRNSRQNDELVDRSDPYDLWLHARRVAGAHVLIKTNAKEVPSDVLEEAAAYAAYYSKHRNEDKVEVMVAEARHVRKLKGGQPGQVTVHQERNSILTRPQPVERDKSS
jgi:predicted ribosome quality control (RQC) complex YloA/Tae2 family protein